MFWFTRESPNVADQTSSKFDSGNDEEHARLELRLRDVLGALRLYLPEIVLVGGWVPALHRRYGGLVGWSSGLSFTSEADVLIADASLPQSGRPPIKELLTGCGLRPVGDTTGAAIWTHADGGEALEFLVPDLGPFRPSSTSVAISGQPGIRAIKLPQIAFLSRHAASIHLPAIPPSREWNVLGGMTDRSALTVRVARLGAYMINKAATFPRRAARSGQAFNSKRAKDVLYLRDLMAGGGAATDTITRDVQAVYNSDLPGRDLVDIAVSHLELALAGRFADDVDRAAAMLNERDGSRSPSNARNDIRGHLTDALEILRPFRSPNPAASDVED